jgi:hypothetical protein
MSAHHEGPHDIIFSILFVMCSAVDIFPSVFISKTTSVSVLPYCDIPNFSFHTRQREKLFHCALKLADRKGVLAVGRGSLNVVCSYIAVRVQVAFVTVPKYINFVIFLNDV